MPTVALSAACLLFLGWGVAVYKKSRRLETLLPVVTLACFAVMLFLFYQKVSSSVFIEHNWMRLQKTFVLSKGYSIYPDIETGPVLNSIYGPLSAFAFWPATWADSPLNTVPYGVLCNLFYFFTPVLLMCLGGRKRPAKALLISLLCFFCFVFLAALLTSLKRSGFTIHADAPALGFGAAAAAFLYGRKGPGHKLPSLFLSSFFLWAAIGSKQTALPLIAALPLFVLLTEGWKRAGIYLFFLALNGAGFFYFFIQIFDAQSMFYNTVLLPSRHPIVLPDAGRFFKSLFRLVREPLLIACVMAPLFVLFVSRPKKSVRAFLKTYRWLLFWLIAAFMAPAAFAANAKIGGSNNTLSFVTYFALIGCVLAFKETGMRYGWTFPGLIARRAVFFYSLLLLTITVPVLFYRFATVPKGPSRAEWAYRYAAAHPGKSYFPRLTIVHLLAEGKLYHESEGLTDRRWANLPVSKAQLLAHIPEDLEWIAFAGENHRDALDIPGFSTGYQNFEALPGFVVYPKEPQA